MKYRFLSAAVLAGGLVLPCLQVAGQVADREKIIDVGELRDAMAKAAQPMAERIRSTTLADRFARVAQLLQEPGVEQNELLAALKELHAELDSFTQGWSEVEEPLWQGQQSIGHTIDRVRLILARGATDDQPRAHNTKLLENYDRRLSDLARAIKSEPDEVRQQRLKRLFANTLSLRKLVEVYGRIDLRPASQAMLAQLVKALMRLEDQLTTATFQVERARIVLGQTGEFVGGYIMIIEDLAEAEGLATMLAEMQSTGTGIGALVTDLSGLTQDVEQFTVLMEGYMSRIAAKIEVEASRIAQNFEAQDVADLDIDAEIDRYFNVVQPEVADGAGR